MWLNIFKYKDKPLSAVEYLVLSVLDDDDFTKSTDLIGSLKEMFIHWNPEKGTIYPVLHRLHAAGLVERGEGRELRFRRSKNALSFLRGTAEPLSEQIEVSVKYFLKIVNDLVHADPLAARGVISNLRPLFEGGLTELEKLEELSKELEVKEGWKEVEIE